MSLRETIIMTLDLRVLVEKSLHEPLTIRDIEQLSVSSRCALIKRIVDKSRSKKTVGSFRPANDSLQALNSAFNISSGFHDWQRRKRQQLITKITDRDNRHILTAYRNWPKLSNSAKQFVLKQSVTLHRDVYVEGLSEKLPYSHIFQEGALRHTREGIILTYGSFSGNLKTGLSKITQYLHCGELLKDAKEAFNTGHHEGSHLIQHHFAVAFHRNQIPHSHPLFLEASYFHSVDRHKAHIPSSYGDVYKGQPNEVFAHWEGEKISTAIDSLAL